MDKLALRRKFLLYVLFSGFAALVNFSSRFLYESIPGVQFDIAVTLAYLTGMMVNFAFSKWITFQSANSGRFKREAIKFFLVASIGLLVTVIVAGLSLRILLHFWNGLDSLPIDLNEESLATLAHLAGMAAGLIANFIGHELLSFRKTGVIDKFKALLKQSNRDPS